MSAASVALRPAQPLGRDVGERAGNVAERRQRVELGHLGEPEVEQANVDRAPLAALRLGEQDVRGLDVAMDDAAPVGVCERLGDLRGDLDRGSVVQLARRASPRAASGRGCTRRRCRRGSCRGRGR